MTKGADFTCPNCGKKNLVSLTQIKKNLKSSTPIVLACGCSLPPEEIIDEMAKILREELRKINPNLPQ